MGIDVGRFRFEGPYRDTSYLRDEQGVYAIRCEPIVGRPSVVDIGESENVRARVANHDRASCWRRNCYAALSVAVLYTPGWWAGQRRALESELRQQFQPACGDR